jgi:sugar phosphate isomerase/epimerase
MAKSVLAAQLYTVREFTQTLPDIVQTFQKVKDIGYEAVQISGFGPVDPKEIAKAVTDSGLTVCATHMGWDRFLNELDAVIEEHKMWGCVHTAIGGIFGEDYSSVDGVKRFLDELDPVAEKLEAEGMDFSYHNHSHELVPYDGKTWLARLYDDGDPKKLKAEIDTYWITHGGGDPAAWVTKCAGREPLLHLKDMTVSTKREQRMAEIGEGNLNWPAILDAAKKGGVEWYLVEQDDCYERDPFESLAISYRNLKAMGME